MRYLMTRFGQELEQIRIPKNRENSAKKLASSWGKAISNLEQKAGKQQLILEDFWSIMAVPITALYQVNNRIPSLSIRIGVKCEGPGPKVRVTIESPAEKSSWVTRTKNWSISEIFEATLLKTRPRPGSQQVHTAASC